MQPSKLTGPGSRRGLLSAVRGLTGDIAIIVALLAVAPVQAASVESAQIRTWVRDFLDERARERGVSPEIEISGPDPRLALPACHDNPEMFLATGDVAAAHVTVGVRCAGPKPWTVYVPARLRAYSDVLVARAAFARGQVVSDTDLIMERRELSAVAGVPLTETAQAVGRLARRAIEPGTVLSATMLDAARLVRRGEQITIIAEAPGIAIQAPGEALMDGSNGDAIRVRNLSSRKVIHAVVTAPAEVRARP